MDNKAGSVVVVTGLGLSFYWMFTYSGPYRYLAELQMKWFGAYVPKITILLIVLGFVGIAAGIKLILRGAERPAPVMPQGSVVSDPGSSAATGVALKPAISPNALLLSPYARLLVILVPLGMGGYLYFNAAQAGELRQLQVAEVDTGRVNSRVVYADVRGYLSRNYMMKDNYMYIPMLNTETAAPAHVLIGVDKKQARQYLLPQADGTFVVRGMVEKNLEGDVRVAFEKNGIPLGDNVWVLHTGRSPRSDEKFSLILIAISVGVGIPLAIWFAYKNKKNAILTSAGVKA